MNTVYHIDIDPNSEQYSSAFKEFFHHHFINAHDLGRGDADTSFFIKMTDEEKQTAKRLIRNNLRLRQPHLFSAAGALHDEQALPILYEEFNRNTNLSWLLSIGQAIWRINADDIYIELLRKLQVHPDPNCKAAHFKQVTDFKNKESIEMLLTYLNDMDRFVRSLALAKLNYISTGKYDFEKNHFDRKYYLKNAADEDFKNKLLMNLKELK